MPEVVLRRLLFYRFYSNKLYHDIMIILKLICIRLNKTGNVRIT
jgi:hypothetical protein